MKNMFIAIALLAILVSLQGIASAKEISGTVAGIDAAANKLTVSYTSPEDQTSQTAEILVVPETTYNGIGSFSEIKAGQAVTIQASDETGTWIAAAVKVPEVKAAGTDAATVVPAAKEPAAQ